ncbi:hypothetical protein CGC48_05370 [Capnocytophaga cynodegmi]|uniref:Mucoidy inhibitor MuiA family protein n=1 Tax=Capnocytophaga cynodegmi TaxID=28189 RepID=A0A250E5B5_9FLAO|nr:DUF4139 domain-containing protein [Capnocytophaga cynodegmi]ATA68110.1 hypothetical protein CGC48_05370 [Capnocytophaga cynodegmi]
MNRNVGIIFFAIFTCLTNLFYAQAPVFTNAKAEKVQLYFNGAEIQQIANVTLPKGTSEIVISNVANYLDENSIQIKSTSKVTILSVQFTNQAITGYEESYIPESVRPIYDSIQAVEKEITKNEILENSIIKSVELLDKNQQLSGANVNSAELSKLLDFYKNKRYELENQIKNISEKGKELQKKLNSLKFRLGAISSQNTNNRGKLILRVINENAGKIPFQLNYISYQAHWNPFYEVRSEKINTPIMLKYNAAVTQNTGVDWNDVKIVLSSGYVNSHTQAPTLNTWFIHSRKNDSAKVMLQEISNVRREKAAFQKNMQTMELESVEVAKEDMILEDKSLDDAVVVGETQFNVVFDIDLPYTILSNGKKHSVSLKSVEIPATYQYYSAPKYDLGAYLIGNIENYGKYNLLSGEASLIFEGMYVGKTNINPENADKKLVLSLGKDKRIVTERKLISKNTENKSLSSKKIQTFTYEISVQNNKKEAITIEIEDQVPVSTEKTIKVSLTEAKEATFDKEKGSLKWKINLKPNENKKIRFVYQVESDRDTIVENL